MTTAARKLLERLHERREYYRQRGHKADCSIGYYDGQIKLADDNGAYDFHTSHRGTWYSNSVGCPNMSTLFIAGDCEGMPCDT